ncbi:hypothetical protein EON79_11870, partial [bacterium]
MHPRLLHFTYIFAFSREDRHSGGMKCRFVFPALLLATAVLLPGLASAQRVVAWGDNGYGQCNPPALQAGQISAGFLGGFLLYSDGAPRSWGSNMFGQFNYPGGLTNQISAGYFHTLVLRPNGTVSAFGENGYGQCNVPAGLVAAQVSGGYRHSVAVRGDGSVAAWGDNTYGQTNIFNYVSGLRQAAAGSYHTIGLRTDGTVIGWGRNDFGQIQVPSGLTGTQVAAGDSFSMALRPNGSVAAWGWNDVGQSTVPAGLVATQIAAGGKHALALRPNGTVTGWGNNAFGQLNIPGVLTGVVEIAAGYNYSLATVAYAHVTMDQGEIYSGYEAGGAVKLAFPAPAGGLNVPLISDDPNVHVPASVRVPAGSTYASFYATTDTVIGSDRTVTIRTAAGSTDSERRTVPSKITFVPLKATVQFNKPSLIGGSTTKASFHVELSELIYEPITLQIVSSDPALSLPTSVTINGWQQGADVNVLKTSPVSSARTVSALLSSNGVQVASGGLTVNPIRANVTLVTPILSSGQTGEGAVYLNTTVGSPMTVALSSGDPSVAVPPTVTVAAGARFIDFPIVTSPIGVNRTVPITVTIAGNPFTANLRVLAVPGVKSLTLPASMYGHGKVTGT